MLADAQTDCLIDQWTNCKTATQNLSGDWLRCYDLLFIPHGNLKPLKHCSRETHLSKGNSTFNLENTHSMVTLHNAFQNFLTLNNNYNLQYYILSRRVYELSSMFFVLHLSCEQK